MKTVSLSLTPPNNSLTMSFALASTTRVLQGLLYSDVLDSAVGKSQLKLLLS